MSQRGFSLVEAIVTSALLIGCGGAILLGMQGASLHTELLKQNQIAMNAAQGRLDQLASEKFDMLASDPSFAAAREASQQEALSSLPGGVLAFQIRQPAADAAINPPPAGSPTILSSAALLDLHVAVCWSFRNRVIGEAGCVDADGDGWVRSPIMVSTRIGRRGG